MLCARQTVGPLGPGGFLHVFLMCPYSRQLRHFLFLPLPEGAGSGRGSSSSNDGAGAAGSAEGVPVEGVVVAGASPEAGVVNIGSTTGGGRLGRGARKVGGAAFSLAPPALAGPLQFELESHAERLEAHVLAHGKLQVLEEGAREVAED